MLSAPLKTPLDTIETTQPPYPDRPGGGHCTAQQFPWSELVRAAAAWLTGAVLPHLCALCQSRVQSPGVCPACWPSLHPLVAPLCPLCGNPVSAPVYPSATTVDSPPGFSTGKNPSICSNCHVCAPHFHSHRAVWAYGPASRRLIFALKYGRKRHLAKWMADTLVPLALAAGQHDRACTKSPNTIMGLDAIVPIPLHPRRLAQRGFNQAGLLATHLGKALGLPVLTQLLTRPKRTPSQRLLSARQRQDNVSASFACTTGGVPARLLVVDDVFTTGATLNAAALVLQDAGALRVHCVTLAKVMA